MADQIDINPEDAPLLLEFYRSKQAQDQKIIEEAQNRMRRMMPVISQLEGIINSRKVSRNPELFHTSPVATIPNTYNPEWKLPAKVLYVFNAVGHGMTVGEIADEMMVYDAPLKERLTRAKLVTQLSAYIGTHIKNTPPEKLLFARTTINGEFVNGLIGWFDQNGTLKDTFMPVAA